MRKEKSTAPLGRNDLLNRLALSEAETLLLVDAPPSLRELLDSERPKDRPARAIAGKAIRSVKETFDAILVWREDREGSRSLLDQLVKRLSPGGILWVVTAKRKVMGPKTPAARRIELPDLVKAFSKQGLAQDREAKVSAWNVAYRFRRPG